MHPIGPDTHRAFRVEFIIPQTVQAFAARLNDANLSRACAFAPLPHPPPPPPLPSPPPLLRPAPSDAATYMYKPQEGREQFSGLLTTLKTVLIDNRQLSLSRVDAFIKRCLLTATHAPQHIALALLAFFTCARAQVSQVQPLVLVIVR
jgi:CBF/Mak21 family